MVGLSTDRRFLATEKRTMKQTSTLSAILLALGLTKPQKSNSLQVTKASVPAAVPMNRPARRPAAAPRPPATSPHLTQNIVTYNITVENLQIVHNHPQTAVAYSVAAPLPPCCAGRHPITGEPDMQYDQHQLNCHAVWADMHLAEMAEGG